MEDRVTDPRQGPSKPPTGDPFSPPACQCEGKDSELPHTGGEAWVPESPCGRPPAELPPGAVVRMRSQLPVCSATVSFYLLQQLVLLHGGKGSHYISVSVFL